MDREFDTNIERSVDLSARFDALALEPAGFEDEVREYANTLGITENIRLMGFRSPGSQWLSACDLLMVTSIEEPFGRALVEAMLLETPIVATDSGGNPGLPDSLE